MEYIRNRITAVISNKLIDIVPGDGDGSPGTIASIQCTYFATSVKITY